MAGCNLVDLMELSSAKRQIVRLILRETMMTYDELCDSVRDLQHLDQVQVEELLDELTSNQWIVPLLKDQETIYRVNLVRKSANHNQAFWHRLGIEQSASSDESDDRSMLRGGKRTLPTAIWDSLESEQTITRETLMSAITQRKQPRLNTGSDRARALRKRLYDALDAVANDDSTG